MTNNEHDPALMRACNAPAGELTKDDLLILEDWNPQVAAERRGERDRAIAAVMARRAEEDRRAAQQKAAQPQRAATPAKKSARAYLQAPSYGHEGATTEEEVKARVEAWADSVSTPEGLCKWAESERNQLSGVPLWLWRMFVESGREKREALAAEVEELKARISALEAKPGINYRGTWKDSEVYQAGSFCTHAGSMWYAKTDSVSRRPGTDAGASAWVLVVKRGSDGRNAE